MKPEYMVTTGSVGRSRDTSKYRETDDPTLRATIIAHLIRTGNRPAVGVQVGFSTRQRVGEMSESGEIDIEKATPVTEKEWVRVTVTQADIDAAHALINEQRQGYRGDSSQVKVDE